MSTWTKQKLGALAEVLMGQSPESKYYNERGEGLQFFQGVKDFGEKYPTVTKWTTSANKVANEGDILFSVRAPVGDINVAQYECALGRGVCAIRSKHEQGDFLYFLLHGNIKKITNVGNGAIYDSINKPTLENIELLIPALPTQTRIASVLSAYDDLIENNEKRIKALEEMAELLYTEWFVKFKFPGHEKIKLVDSGTSYGKIPEGWEIGKVSDIANIISGFPFKGSTYQDSGKYKIVTIKNVHDGQFVLNFDSFLDELPSKLPQLCILNAGDILLSLTGNVGRVCVVYGKDHVLNQRVAKLQPTVMINREFIYSLFRQRRFQQKLEAMSNGAAQQNLSPVQVKDMNIIIPESEVMKEFGQICSKYFDTNLFLQEKNQTLSNIRDLLIPQLVTGKRELKNI